jgi:hypothetical protein
MPFLTVGGDPSEPGVDEAMVQRALNDGQIDTLVNNASALIRLRLIDCTEEDAKGGAGTSGTHCAAASWCCRT